MEPGGQKEAADDTKCVGWARDFFDATVPYSTGGVYSNYMDRDEDERMSAAFSPIPPVNTSASIRPMAA